MMRGVAPLLALFAIRLTPAIAFESAAVAMPAMIAALGFDHAQAGLVLGAFMLPGAAVSVLAGLLAKRVGDGPVLLGGLLLLTLGSFAASRAPGYPALLVWRATAGIGGVAILMLILKMTTDRYAGPWLASASAVTITAWPAGLALGLFALGPVPTALGWQATLGLAGAPAAIALLLVPLTGRAQSARPASVAAQPDEQATPALSFLIAGVLTWSLINAVLAIIVGFLPGYLAALGASMSQAARVSSIAVWTPAVGISLGGLLADRMTGRPAAIVAGLLATGAVLGAVGMGATSPAAMVVLGLAFSAAPGSVTAQFGQAIPLRLRAVAFGCYSGGSYVAIALAPWMAGWLRDATGVPGAPMLFAAALSLMALAPYAVMAGGGARPSSPRQRESMYRAVGARWRGHDD